MKTSFIGAILFLLFITSCKKHTTSSDGPASGKLSVFTNTKFANAKDTLQAIYKPDNSTVNYACYGSFKSDGTPDKIKEVVTSRGDTAVKMIMDDKMRVKTIFFTYKNVKDSTVFFLRYTDTTTSITTAAFYWAKGTHKFKATTVIKNSTLNVKSSNLYSFNYNIHSSFGSGSTRLGFINILGFIGINNAPQNIFDYTKQMATALGGVIVANAAMVAGYTAAGAFLGGSTTVGIGALPGAIIGGAFGIYKAIKSSGFNSETVDVNSANNYIDADPNYASNYSTQSPATDLNNTEITNSKIENGTSDSGTQRDFAGDCGGAADQARIYDVNLEIIFNSAGTSVTNAYYHCKYVFGYGTTTLPTNTYGPFGGMKMSGASISNGLVTINWPGIWGGTDRFVGVINGNEIQGTFYWNLGYGCQSGGNHIVEVQADIGAGTIN